MPNQSRELDELTSELGLLVCLSKNYVTRSTPTMSSATSNSPSTLRRFLLIVACTFGGAIVCAQWAMLLLVLDDRLDGSSGGNVPEGVGERVVWSLVNPVTWMLGAWLGLFFVFPALACLWNRRLVPSVRLVMAVALVATTWSVGANVVGALPITAVATAVALAFVRVLPLRAWSVRPRVA